MLDDADVIKRSVEAVTGQGKEVVVVCHSYGGTPTTQALAGLKGVKRVVYLAAIIPKVGESNAVAMGGKDGELPFAMTVSLFFPLDFPRVSAQLDVVLRAGRGAVREEDEDLSLVREFCASRC